VVVGSVVSAIEGIVLLDRIGKEPVRGSRDSPTVVR
jgi:hypothetical protein